MLYLIGLGLGDAKDITVRGLEVVRRCSRVYLEAYTSVLTVGKEALVRDKVPGHREDFQRASGSRSLDCTDPLKHTLSSLRSASYSVAWEMKR